jgi:hypothetical protein
VTTKQPWSRLHRSKLIMDCFAPLAMTEPSYVSSIRIRLVTFSPSTKDLFPILMVRL